MSGQEPIPIIYENHEIIIINKRAGLAVQGGEKISHPLDKILPEQTGYPVYLVHRLDMETSGLMIVAKSPQSASKWTRLISEKEVIKEYEALCVGLPPEKKGKITSSIKDRGVEKASLTYYELVSSIVIPDSEITLSRLHLRLGTGRMHQIRIHLASKGLPIAGDDKYGNFKVNKLLKKAVGIKRLTLASVRLVIPGPLLGMKEQAVFEVPLPPHMNIEGL